MSRPDVPATTRRDAGPAPSGPGVPRPASARAGAPSAAVAPARGGFGGAVAPWRAAWRVARREAWRGRAARRRTAVVMLLVGLPVFFGGVLAVVLGSGSSYTADTWQFATSVRAVASFTVDTGRTGIDDADLARASAAWSRAGQRLPDADRLVEDLQVKAVVAVGDQRRTVRTHVVADTSVVPLVAPVDEGTTPVGPDEVALTHGAADDLGVAVGGTVTVTILHDQGDKGAGFDTVPEARQVKVVGLYDDAVEAGSWYDSRGASEGYGLITADTSLVPEAEQVERAVGHLRGWVVGDTAVGLTSIDLTGEHLGHFHLSTPAALGETQRHRGASLVGTFLTSSPFGTGRLLAVELGLAVMLQIAFIAAPALAVGARRRGQVAGLLAVTGSTRAQTVRTMLLSGALMGVPGAVVGALVGGATGYLLMSAVGAVPVTSYGAEVVMSTSGYRPLPELHWVDLALLALVGSVVSVCTALLPALTASRTHPLRAVRGVRPSRRRTGPRTGWAGVALMMLGGAAAVMGASTSTAESTTGKFVLSIGGIIVAEIGFVLVLPAVVAGCARLVARGPVPLRMAARDADRHRLRTVPAVAATAAAVAAGFACLLIITVLVSRSTYGEPSAGSTGQILVTPVSQVPADDATGWIGDVGAAFSAEGTTLTDVGAVYSYGDATVADTFTADSGRTYTVGGTSLTFSRPESNRCSSRDIDEHTWDWATSGTSKGRLVCRPASTRLGTSIRSWGLIGTDEAGLRVVAGSVDPAAEQAFAEGKVVTSDPLLIWPDGTVHITVWAEPKSSYDHVTGDYVAPVRSREIVLPAVLIDAEHGVEGVVPLATAEQVGLTASLQGVLATPVLTRTTPVELVQGLVEGAVVRDGVSKAVTTLEPKATITVEGGRQTETLQWAIVAAAFVVTLFGAVSAVALASGEGRDDMVTLAAVGASPRTRKAWVAMQALLVSGLGAGGGVVTGALVGRVLCAAASQSSDWIASTHHVFSLGGMPWAVVVALLVALPAGITALFWCLTPARLPLLRREG